MNDTYISTEDLNKKLDEAYNQGIDHAIQIVEEYKKVGYSHHALGAIVDKLEQLKKQ